MTEQLASNIKRIVKVLNKNDLQAFIDATKDQSTSSKRDVAEITMHKLRAELTGVRPDLKLKSRLWLKSRGYQQLSGVKT